MSMSTNKHYKLIENDRDESLLTSTLSRSPDLMKSIRAVACVMTSI